jgi:putative transposase
MLFHVLNRGVGRQRLFDTPADYAAFEDVLEETLDKQSMRICSYCLMPNHWHLVLWPENDGDLAAFMQRLTVTHVTRWQKHRHRVGEGHVYQGRFKSFPVETDEYFYQVARYVERNALRANLVPHAEDWQWSSLWRRERGSPAQRRWLGKWPLAQPRHWLELVNQPQTDDELNALRHCVLKGQPFGSTSWKEQTATQLGLESTLRSRGRPRRIDTEDD